MVQPAAIVTEAPLDRAFFARPTVKVARELIGCHLMVDPGTPDEIMATLVEVEAYLELEDPTSHAHRRPTPRAAIIFGPAEHLYVYLSYDVHHCANLVTESAGVAGAVLLRSAQVESGHEVIHRRRTAHLSRHTPLAAAAHVIPAHDLLQNPGNLCRGLGIDLRDNGDDVCSRASHVEVWPAGRRPRVTRAPRVGITRAADRPLRFAWRDHPAVSHPPLR